MLDPAKRFLSFRRLAALLLTVIVCGCDSTTKDNRGFEPCPKQDRMTIDSTQVWGPEDSPIVIDRDVYVSQTGRLTLLAGTTVQFKLGAVTICDPAGNLHRQPNFYIDGELICRGTEASPVSFVGYEGDWPMGEWIEVSQDEQGFAQVSMEWSEFRFVRSSGREPRFSNCRGTSLWLHGASDAKVDSCIMEEYNIGNSTGEFTSNIVIRSAYIYGGSITVSDNVFEGTLKLTHDNKSRVTGNLIRNSDTGVTVISASPEIHHNNFEGNRVNLLVERFWSAPPIDSLNVTDNWWGTSDEGEIRRLIKISSGSLNNLVFLPFATEPFH